VNSIVNYCLSFRVFVIWQWYCLLFRFTALITPLRSSSIT